MICNVYNFIKYTNSLFHYEYLRLILWKFIEKYMLYNEKFWTKPSSELLGVDYGGRYGGSTGNQLGLLLHVALRVTLGYTLLFI